MRRTSLTPLLLAPVVSTLCTTTPAEFYASPRNYAHWLLAHVYPTIVKLAKTTSFQSIDVGPDLAYWSPQYRELLAPRNVTFLGGGDECLPVEVPHLSFCTLEYWRHVDVLALFLQRRFQHVQSGGKKIMFILLREDRDRSWDVDGLTDACADKQWRETYKVVCGSFSQRTPLSEVAKALGNVRGIIAAHGAGLANVVFLSPGATVIELDAGEHRSYNRFFYGELAKNLGLRYRKVWLGHVKDEIQNCTQIRHDGTMIHGNSDPELLEARIRSYNRPAKIDRQMLTQLVDTRWNVVWPGAECRVETGADGDCPALVEREFFFDVVFRDLDPVLVDDQMSDRTIYVVHIGEQTPVTERDRIRRLGEDLQQRGYRSVILVHLSDEHGTIDDFYDPWPLILRQYWSPQLLTKWGHQRLMFLPLGYASGHKKSSDLSRPITNRTIDWTFIGHKGGSATHRTRPWMLGNMSKVANFVTHLTSRVAVGTPWRDELWPAHKIADVMQQSRFCPAPMGFVAPDTFRVWEALEAECLPLVDALDVHRGGAVLHGADYFSSFVAYLCETYISHDEDHVCDGQRRIFLEVSTWTGIAGAVTTALATLADLDQQQSVQRRWWTALKAGISRTLTSSSVVVSDP